MTRRRAPLAFAALTVGVTLVLGWQERRLQTRQRQECLAVLRWVDAAKEQLCMDSRLRSGYQPQWRELRTYFQDPGKVVCPEGGTIILGEFHSPAYCSVHGVLGS
ncbi:hypothetical protein [Armatimonas sp.]|uniref:hypothetical protein n=1 Tax=Armatimonas sp. TaxID=1872638 RepID=UPI00286C5509|nr:hypothetical protein [Armatimonas sp.]